MTSDAERWALERWAAELAVGAIGHAADAYALDVLAAATALRIERELRWIYRRIERFEFLDDRRVHKRIAVDLVVPTSFDAAGTPGPPTLPIARPRKRFMRSLSVTDEAGASLTTLTRDENALISTKLLTNVAEAALTAGSDQHPALVHGPLREHVEQNGIPASLIGDFADVAGLRLHVHDYPAESDRQARVVAALRRFSEPGADQQTADDELRAILWADYESACCFGSSPSASCCSFRISAWPAPGGALSSLTTTSWMPKSTRRHIPARSEVAPA
jgi:hypothetical protein